MRKKYIYKNSFLNYATWKRSWSSLSCTSVELSGRYSITIIALCSGTSYGRSLARWIIQQ